jgi:hypothetical protein
VPPINDIAAITIIVSGSNGILPMPLHPNYPLQTSTGVTFTATMRLGEITMDFLVGIVFFLVLGACILVPRYFRHLTRTKEMEALVKLAENGTDVQLAVMALVRRQYSPQQDLRKGVLLMAVAIPLVTLGWVQSEPFIAIVFGGIPLLVGLAYLYMAKNAKPSADEAEH